MLENSVSKKWILKIKFLFLNIEDVIKSNQFILKYNFKNFTVELS